MKKLVTLLLITFTAVSYESNAAPTQANTAFPGIHNQQLLNYHLEPLSSRLGGGVVNQFSIGSKNNIWGTTTNHKIVKWDTNNKKWVTVPEKQSKGRLDMLSVAPDGRMWGVSASQIIYHWQNNQWNRYAGKLKKISVGSKGGHHVFGVNAAGRIYHHPWASKWGYVPLKDEDTGTNKIAKDISVASDGSLWAISTDGLIYKNSVHKDAAYNKRIAPGKWTLIPGKLEQISVGSRLRIFGTNKNHIVFRRNVGRDNWAAILQNFKSIDVAEDGTLWGIGKNNKIYEVHDTFFGNRLSIVGGMRSVGDLNAVYDHYRTKKHEHPFNEYKGTSPFLEKYSWSSWIALQGDERLKNDIEFLKNQRDTLQKSYAERALITRLKLKYLERLARYDHKNKRIYEAFINLPYLGHYLLELKKLVDNRNELVSYPILTRVEPVKSNSLLPLQSAITTIISRASALVDETTGDFRSYTSLQRYYLRKLLIPKTEAERKNGSQDIRLPDLLEDATKLLSLSDALAQARNKFDASISNPEASSWLKDYEQRATWIEKIRYLVESMASPEFTEILKTDNKTSLEKLFKDVKSFLYATTEYGSRRSLLTSWSTKFSQTERSRLEALIEAGLNKIEKEKERIQETTVKTFMGLLAETKAQQFLVSAVSSGENQDLLFKNLKTLSEQVASRPLSEAEVYLELINKLEDFSAKGYFNFDVPTKKALLEGYIDEGKKLYLSILKEIGTRDRVIAAAGAAASSDPTQQEKYEQWLKTTTAITEKLVSKTSRSPEETTALKNLLPLLDDPTRGLKELFPAHTKAKISSLITKLKTVVPAAKTKVKIVGSIVQKVSPESLTTTLKSLHEAFNDYSARIHANQTLQAQWLSDLEVIVKNRIMLPNQNQFDNLINLIKETNDADWLAEEWFTRFTPAQQSQLKNLVAQGEQPIDYNSMFSYFRENRSQLSPQVLIDLIALLIEHPSSKLSKNENQRAWIIREAKNEANKRFSQEEKENLNRVLSETETPEPTLAQPPAARTTGEQTQLWRNQVDNWNRQILDWRAAGIATMDQPTAEKTKSDMANVKSKMDQLSDQDLPPDLQNLLDAGMTALSGLQTQVQNRINQVTPKQTPLLRRPARGRVMSRVPTTRVRRGGVRR
ncbi:hypothetical protein KKA53_00300 [Candidatus Dependentiae bacterium]|nr:hypothetical protein [Candidatus Dependentiae bacterium]